MLLAAAVFPAFSAPSATPLLQPLAVAAGVLAEVIVFRFAYRRQLAWGRVVSLTLGVNLITWFLGAFVSLILPSGLVSGAAIDRPVMAGPHYHAYLVAAYVAAFFFAVIVDTGLWRGFTRKAPLPRLGAVVFLANAVNDLCFLGVVFATHGRSW